MDPIGWFIATTHQLLGHDKVALLVGHPEDVGRQTECVICAYERRPTDANRIAVYEALKP